MMDILITFSEDDARELYHPYADAIVITLSVQASFYIESLLIIEVQLIYYSC